MTSRADTTSFVGSSCRYCACIASEVDRSSPIRANKARRCRIRYSSWDSVLHGTYTNAKPHEAFSSSGTFSSSIWRTWNNICAFDATSFAHSLLEVVSRDNISVMHARINFRVSPAHFRESSLSDRDARKTPLMASLYKTWQSDVPIASCKTHDISCAQ